MRRHLYKQNKPNLPLSSTLVYKPSTFHSCLQIKAFCFVQVNTAVTGLAQHDSSFRQVEGLSKRCCDLFAEKPRTPTGETLGKLAAFRKDGTTEGQLRSTKTHKNLTKQLLKTHKTSQRTNAGCKSIVCYMIWRPHRHKSTRPT